MSKLGLASHADMAICGRLSVTEYNSFYSVKGQDFCIAHMPTDTAYRYAIHEIPVAQ